MKNIELEDVLIFHRKLIEHTGGSDGIRDVGLGIADGSLRKMTSNSG